MNLNKVFILGNLTRDPELRQTPAGQAVCTIGIATNRFFNDSSGQRQKQAEFHNVVAWGKQAEIINQYLHKGSMLLVEGRLQTRSWQDQQGQKRYRTEIIAERIQLGPRQQGGGNGGGGGREGVQSSPEDDMMQDGGRTNEPQTPIIELPGDEEIDVKDIPF